MIESKPQREKELRFGPIMPNIMKVRDMDWTFPYERKKERYVFL